MPFPTTYTENEISLGGYRLPISGPIQVTEINHFPSKITTGKSSRSDQVIADEWIQDDWREGLLINQLEEQVHRGRFWWSTVSTHLKRKLTLAPSVMSIGTPTGVTADCELMIEFNSVLYCCFNGIVYSWDGSAWSGSLKNLGSAAIDAIEYNNTLYISTGGGYSYTSNGSSWTDSTTDVDYFTVFDASPTQKLAAITNTGLVQLSADGITWDSSTVGGQIYDAIPTDLLSYRNANDEPTLYAATDRGLYSIDVWTRLTYLTSLQTIWDENGGKGSIVWGDGNLYFPHRKAIWRYPRLGQITDVGVDREDGLPPFTKGHIVKLIPTPNFLIALIDADAVTGVIDEEMEVGMEFNSQIIQTQASSSSHSVVLGWDGSGWHTFYAAPSVGTTIQAGLFTTTFNDETRVFFAEDNTIYYVVVPEGNYDPLQDSSASFNSSGILITSWFDSDYSEILKLATSFKLRLKNITNTNTITVLYQINDSGSDTDPAFPNSSWNQLAVIQTSDSAGTTDASSATSPHTVSFTPSTGVAKIIINPPNGLQFFSIRFKIILAGSGSSSPAILFFNLRHKKLPDIIWGYTMKIIGNDQEHLQDTWQAIRTLADNKQTVRFGFRNIEEEEKIVLVNSVSGIRWAGSENPSHFTITVIELES